METVVDIHGILTRVYAYADIRDFYIVHVNIRGICDKHLDNVYEGIHNASFQLFMFFLDTNLITHGFFGNPEDTDDSQRWT